MTQFTKHTGNNGSISLFMCGDVMLGRGVDQILSHPCDPVIYEHYLKSARGYVDIAVQANGPILFPVSDSYVWGDALAELDRASPDLRLINLETSITKSDDYWLNKGISYRMSPENIACLSTAKIDYCSLANNHVIDWGYSGLQDTLTSLSSINVRYAGAGLTAYEAEAPVAIEVNGKGRVLVLSCGCGSSGIPWEWTATENKPGVYVLRDLSDDMVSGIKEKIGAVVQPGDIIVISVHWGGNWGYEIDPEQIQFAHKLIDEAGADIIHGHSSHHVKGIEMYKDKLILYGCGDFINDYEGIRSHLEYRGDLGLMYFVKVSPVTGKLLSLRMTPTQIKHLRVNRASSADTLWLKDVLNREGKQFGTRVEQNMDNSFTLKWKAGDS